MADMKKKSRAGRQRKLMHQYKQGIILISCTLLLMVAVIAFGAVSLQKKKDAYKKQISELETQLAEEKERSEEIDDMQDYVGTREYIEEIAREKLGLAYPDEIILEPEQ